MAKNGASARDSYVAGFVFELEKLTADRWEAKPGRHEYIFDVRNERWPASIEHASEWTYAVRLRFSHHDPTLEARLSLREKLGSRITTNPKHLARRVINALPFAIVRWEEICDEADEDRSTSQHVEILARELAEILGVEVKKPTYSQDRWCVYTTDGLTFDVAAGSHGNTYVEVRRGNVSERLALALASAQSKCPKDP